MGLSLPIQSGTLCDIVGRRAFCGYALISTHTTVRSLIMAICICTCNTASCIADSLALTAEVQKLVSPDASAAIDAHFGYSLDLFGQVLAIGAPDDKPSSFFEAGAVYIFDKQGDTFQWKQKLSLPNGAAYDWFGQAIDIYDNKMIIGAPVRNGPGSVYIFENEDTGWRQIAHISPDHQRGVAVGYVVAMTNEIAAIGDPVSFGHNGQVLVYTQNGDTWSEIAALTPSADYAATSFGSEIVLWEDQMFVSAPHNSAGVDYGSVFHYRMSGDSWILNEVLTASDSSNFDGFGTSMSFDGTRLVIGAPFKDVSRGAVYIFEPSAEGWIEVAKLRAEDGGTYDGFGYDVAIDGGLVVVGAPDAHNQLRHGTAYIYRFDGNQWSEVDQVIGSDTSDSDHLGWALALDGDTIVAGSPSAPFDPNRPAGVAAGAAYAFVVIPESSGFQRAIVLVGIVALFAKQHRVSRLRRS